MIREGIVAAVTAFYLRQDVPLPSPTFPIAPMGPLIDDAPILCTEIADLTTRVAEKHLLRNGGLRTPFPDGMVDDAPLSGFLYVAGGNLAHVFLRNDQSPSDERPGGLVRRRFSLAHELGHLELHCPAGIEEFHDCYGIGEKDDEEAHAQREREANQFAAELLMPESVVIALAERAIGQGFFGVGLAEEVAMLMLVSREAMIKRLGDLKIETGEA